MHQHQILLEVIVGKQGKNQCNNKFIFVLFCAYFLLFFRGDTEVLSSSRIFSNISHSVPYQHPKNPPKGKFSAVILVGTSASASSIENRMYMQISKQYYAKRHGYKFMHLLSNQIVEYFPND